MTSLKPPAEATRSRPFPWRLFLWTLVVAFGGSAGVYLADRLVYAPMREQERLIAELERRRQELESFVRRLKHTERRAQVIVLDQQRAADGIQTTRFTFTEIDASGAPLYEPREIAILGDEIYFDGWVIKFEDSFVEAGDALKGKSLLLFRRIFSDRLQPKDGYALDREGEAPEAYAAKKAASEFERELWKEFWKIADDPELAKQKGVRAIHGVAPYTRLQKGKVYLIELRATGELTVTVPTALEK